MVVVIILSKRLSCESGDSYGRELSDGSNSSEHMKGIDCRNQVHGVFNRRGVWSTDMAEWLL